MLNLKLLILFSFSN